MRRLLILALWGLPVWGIGIGAKVPDFSLKGTDGVQYGLKAALAENRAAVVLFVATQCPYSNSYNDRYNELVDKLRALTGDKKVAFLAVNSNDTEPFDEVAKHAGARRFRFAVLKDDGHKVADAFGAEKTPEAFLVSSTGEVIYHGRIDDDTEGKNIRRRDLLAAVEEHLAGKPVAVKETKAFGCTIKRR